MKIVFTVPYNTVLIVDESQHKNLLDVLANSGMYQAKGYSDTKYIRSEEEFGISFVKDSAISDYEETAKIAKAEAAEARIATYKATNEKNAMEKRVKELEEKLASITNVVSRDTDE